MLDFLFKKVNIKIGDKMMTNKDIKRLDKLKAQICKKMNWFGVANLFNAGLIGMEISSEFAITQMERQFKKLKTRKCYLKEK